MNWSIILSVDQYCLSWSSWFINILESWFVNLWNYIQRNICVVVGFESIDFFLSFWSYCIFDIMGSFIGFLNWNIFNIINGNWLGTWITDWNIVVIANFKNWSCLLKCRNKNFWNWANWNVSLIISSNWCNLASRLIWMLDFWSFWSLFNWNIGYSIFNNRLSSSFVCNWNIVFITNF